MKKQLIVGIAVLLVCVVFSGCNEQNGQSSEESRFVGTWKTEDTTNASYLVGTSFIFFSDGTTSIGNSNYEVKDGKLVINRPDVGMTLIFDYSFSNDDSILTLVSVSHPDWKADYTKQ